MFLFYSSLEILILSASSEAYSWNKNIPLRRLVAVESVVLWLEVPRARCVDKRPPLRAASLRSVDTELIRTLSIEY